MEKENKEVHLTLRIRRSLKAEVERIAEKERRSLNNAAELLLVKGIQAFKAGHALVDPGLNSISDGNGQSSNGDDQYDRPVLPGHADKKQQRRPTGKGKSGK